ncbi:MAG: MFS transporter, partial [Armatimonadota bacterium]|nr:MFS transporter [Armatimonadota bacterium]
LSPVTRTGRGVPQSDRAGDARTVWTVTAAHFLNDFFLSFLGPLLPLVVQTFDLSLALAGFLATTLTTSSALSQPLFGALADRLRRPVFVVLGPALSVAAMGLVGLAPGYGVLLVLLLVAGTGTASFHPQGAAAAGGAALRRRGAALSVFVAGGELGYAVGPLAIAAAVSAWGLRSTAALAAAGLLACGLLARSLPGRRTSAADPPPARTGPARVAGPLVLLWLVVVLRSILITAYQTFLPLLLHQRGGSLVAGGAAVCAFGGVGALGGISGGLLADRIGRRRTLVLSLVVPVPLLLLFLLTPGPWSYVWLAAGGAALYLSAAVTIVMAQELLPRRAGVASSIVMGLAWGTAGLSLTGVGALADAVGLDRALAGLLALVVPALVAVAGLPRRPGSPP